MTTGELPTCGICGKYIYPQTKHEHEISKLLPRNSETREFVLKLNELVDAVNWCVKFCENQALSEDYVKERPKEECKCNACQRIKEGCKWDGAMWIKNINAQKVEEKRKLWCVLQSIHWKYFNYANSEEKNRAQAEAAVKEVVRVVEEMPYDVCSTYEEFKRELKAKLRELL